MKKTVTFIKVFFVVLLISPTTIFAESNLEVISAWHKLAAKSDSIEAFVERM